VTTPQGRGRYPAYDVLDDERHWDPVTRAAVGARVGVPPLIQFFDDRERRTLQAFLDVVLAQDSEPRVPVLAMIDAKLSAGRLDGYRYDDMPDDDETWRRLARALDGFDRRDRDRQQELVAAFAAGELEFDGLNAKRAWSVVMRGALSAFYSHPWAWNEIGFRGPAYPRGYMRRNMGASGVEPDEPREASGADPVREFDRDGGGAA
jgi:hypothetical protein